MPVMLIDVRKVKEVARFHRFVTPTYATSQATASPIGKETSIELI